MVLGIVFLLSNHNRRYYSKVLVTCFLGLFIVFSIFGVNYFLIPKIKYPSISVEFDKNIKNIDFYDIYKIIKDETKSNSELYFFSDTFESDIVVDRDGNILDFNIAFHCIRGNEKVYYTSKFIDNKLELNCRHLPGRYQTGYKEIETYFIYLQSVNFESVLDNINIRYNEVQQRLFQTKGIDNNFLFGITFDIYYLYNLSWENYDQDLYIIDKNGEINLFNNDNYGTNYKFGINCFLSYGETHLSSSITLSHRYYVFLNNDIDGTPNI